MTSVLLDAAPRLSAHDRGLQFRAALWEVAGYLARMGLTTKYGFQLLHIHFPLDDEAVVQTIRNNELGTRVVPRHQVDGLMPTIWQIAPDGAPIAMQWTEDVAVSTAAPADTDLEAFAQFLAAAGLAQTFAVVDLSQTIKLGPDQVSLEYTDELTRTQRTIAVPRHTVTEAQAATWVATSDGVPVVRGTCHFTGKSH